MSSITMPSENQQAGNVLPFPRDTDICREQAVQCRERLGGLLRYCNKEAAEVGGAASDGYFDHTGSRAA
jgi:hypothetical protein